MTRHYVISFNVPGGYIRVSNENIESASAKHHRLQPTATPMSRNGRPSDRPNAKFKHSRSRSRIPRMPCAFPRKYHASATSQPTPFVRSASIPAARSTWSGSGSMASYEVSEPVSERYCWQRWIVAGMLSGQMNSALLNAWMARIRSPSAV